MAFTKSRGGGRPRGRGGQGFLDNWAKLYATPTKSELAIEPAIAALGIPYRAQHPVFACHAIADFALLGPRILIEVDGRSHNGPAAKAKDRERTARLERQGWVVVRCTNEQAEAEPAATVQRLLLEAADRRNAQLILAGVNPTHRNTNA